MRFLAICLIFFLVLEIVTISIVGIAIVVIVGLIDKAALVEFVKSGLMVDVAKTFLQLTGPVVGLFTLIAMAVIADAAWAKKLRWAIVFNVSSLAGVIFLYLLFTGYLFRTALIPGESALLNGAGIAAPLIGCALATVVVHRVRQIVYRRA